MFEEYYEDEEFSQKIELVKDYVDYVKKRSNFQSVSPAREIQNHGLTSSSSNEKFTPLSRSIITPNSQKNSGFVTPMKPYFKAQTAKLANETPNNSNEIKKINDSVIVEKEKKTENEPKEVINKVNDSKERKKNGSFINSNNNEKKFKNNNIFSNGEGESAQCLNEIPETSRKEPVKKEVESARKDNWDKNYSGNNSYNNNSNMVNTKEITKEANCIEEEIIMCKKSEYSKKKITSKNNIFSNGEEIKEKNSDRKDFRFNRSTHNYDNSISYTNKYNNEQSNTYKKRKTNEFEVVEIIDKGKNPPTSKFFRPSN